VLCRVMLCCVELCGVVLWCVELCCVESSCVVLNCVVLRWVVSCYVVLNWVVSCYVVLNCVVSYYIVLNCVASCYVVLNCVALCYVVLCTHTPIIMAVRPVRSEKCLSIKAFSALSLESFSIHNAKTSVVGVALKIPKANPPYTNNTHTKHTIFHKCLVLIFVFWG